MVEKEEREYLSRTQNESNNTGGTPFIPFFLYIMGILIISAGIYQGMRLLREAQVLDSPYVRYIAMGFSGGGIIAGIFLIGFGRNIALLREIRDKLPES